LEIGPEKKRYTGERAVKELYHNSPVNDIAEILMSIFVNKRFVGCKIPNCLFDLMQNITE